MFALIPTPIHETQEKLDKFLSLISSIAETTYANEPENKSYCWFRKSSLGKRNGHFCCGFEVYSNEESLTVTHRASPEYKMMRAVSADENLFLEPTALIFLSETGESGFIIKEENDVIFGNENTAETLIVVRKYITANTEKTQELVELLNGLAQKAWKLDGVLSYAPLARRDHLKTEISLLERYGSVGAFDRAEDLLGPPRSKAEELLVDMDISYWEKGIGHIRGRG